MKNFICALFIGLFLVSCSHVNTIQLGERTIYHVTTWDFIAPNTVTLMTYDTPPTILNGGTNGGILSVTAGPVAAAYAGHQIGKGIAENSDNISMSNNSTSNSGANSTSSSDSTAVSNSTSESGSDATSVSGISTPITQNTTFEPTTRTYHGECMGCKTTPSERWFKQHPDLSVPW